MVHGRHTYETHSLFFFFVECKTNVLDFPFLFCFVLSLKIPVIVFLGTCHMSSSSLSRGFPAPHGFDPTFERFGRVLESPLYPKIHS